MLTWPGLTGAAFIFDVVFVDTGDVDEKQRKSISIALQLQCSNVNIPVGVKLSLFLGYCWIVVERRGKNFCIEI